MLGRDQGCARHGLGEVRREAEQFWEGGAKAVLGQRGGALLEKRRGSARKEEPRHDKSDVLSWEGGAKAVLSRRGGIELRMSSVEKEQLRL